MEELQRVKNYKKTGCLYLLPNIIAENSRIPLEQTVTESIKNINYYISENEKPLRRLIKKLCPHKDQMKIKVITNNKYSDIDQLYSFLDICKTGENIALISDAGLPCIADPGANIVNKAHQEGITVVPLVGPSSIFLALMASGLGGQHFSFNGYLPIKKGRKQSLQRLEKLAERQNQTQIFIETPYRSQRLFEDILNVLKPTTKLCIASEITSHKEFIITKTIKAWSVDSNKIKLHKKNTVFCIGK